MTAGNLFRWKKVESPNCGLCKSREQSNKHVLSNCSAKCSLTRYTSRHDKILDILAQWLTSVKTNDTSLFADVSSGLYSKIDNVFEPVCRPDVVLVKKSRVFVLELTVCHESNLLKSKLYKYENIKRHLKPQHSHLTSRSVHFRNFRLQTLFQIYLNSSNRPNFQSHYVNTFMDTSLRIIFPL